MKYPLVTAAIALLSINAFALDGTVVDSLGQPIAGALVSLPNSNQRAVVTDAKGRFQVVDGGHEVHVSAPGYSHRIVHLTPDATTQTTTGATQNLVITLPTSLIEQVDVIGLPIHASVIESALPVTVLAGKALRNQQAATLGDSLERQPGVNTNFHGKVASTPVIRGLSGPRVLITQNGLDVGDVSRVGPDHAVASEVSTATQVEILRGPATLFYGSGAIGGVVNVVDGRVPQDSETQGEWLLSRDSVNGQQLGAFNATSGTQSWAFYADGFWRDADDYKVPVAPEQEHEQDHDDEHEEHSDEHSAERVVASSAEESQGFTLGTSYLLDNGFVGIAAERLDREYGIPGHSHGGESEAVYADLEQERYQLQSEFMLDSSWLRAIKTRAAYTDYAHAEVEAGTVGTLFAHETYELRTDFLHREWQHWKGGVNFHYKRSDASAEGEEAFTPASRAEAFALAIMEEKHVGDLLLQWGARIERVTIDANDVRLPPVAAHAADAGHDGHEEHEEHADESGAGYTRLFDVAHRFTPSSLSVGAVWDFTPGYNLGIALSQAERAPSAAELLSFGPHLGSGAYEIGALFALSENAEGEAEALLSRDSIDLERSRNIDLTFRKHQGDVAIILNAFLNNIDNYYYQNSTGLFAESGHAHEGEHAGEHQHESEAVEAEDPHAEELPVYLFTAGDARFYGLEAQLMWKLDDKWTLTTFGDFVRARLQDGSNLPRTPPRRLGWDLEFSHQRWVANVEWIYYASQNDVALLETATDHYALLDAQVAYQIPVKPLELSVFFKGENIANADARVHTSFIKEVAPRPGRNFSLGIRGTF
jgi:iron complex outermembrane recepter protein